MKNFTSKEKNKLNHGLFKNIPEDVLESSIPTMQTYNDRPECVREDSEELITRKKP